MYLINLNTAIIGKAVGDNYLLLLRDTEQKLDVTVSLNSQKIEELLASLKEQGVASSN